MTDFIQHLGLCPIKNILGVPCPACGMTRAFLQAAQFNFKAALDFHPLFWLVPLIFILILFRKRQPLLMKLYQSKWFSPTMIALFVGVYLYRMVQRFPTEVPLDFNQYALLPSLWRFIFV